MEYEDMGEISAAVHEGFRTLANAIMPLNVIGGTDATGIHVESLTEAVMGVTAALTMIADAINNNADAIRESKV